MTAINSITSSTAATSSNALAGMSGISDPTQLQSEFMKLFVAQLQNQDPLNPQNGSDMVGQLAQLSSLEQQTQTNTDLTSILGAQQSQSSAQLASLVGKTATVNASTIQLSGAPPPMQVAVDGAITSGTVTIKDAAGNTVKTINLPPGNGPFQLGWDGTNNAGVQVPSGSYSISVTTTGAGGNSVTGTPEITGTISAVDLGAQGTLLQIGNASVTPADVLSIGATGGTP